MEQTIKIPVTILLDERSHAYWEGECKKNGTKMCDYLPTILREWQPSSYPHTSPY